MRGVLPQNCHTDDRRLLERLWHKGLRNLSDGFPSRGSRVQIPSSAPTNQPGMAWQQAPGEVLGAFVMLGDGRRIPPFSGLSATYSAIRFRGASASGRGARGLPGDGRRFPTLVWASAIYSATRCRDKATRGGAAGDYGRESVSTADTIGLGHFQGHGKLDGRHAGARGACASRLEPVPLGTEGRLTT